MAFIPSTSLPFRTLQQHRFQICRSPVQQTRHAVRRISPTAAYTARTVSADELEAVIQKNERPVLVDAYAQWCGPCQFMIPQLDVVAEKYGDRLDIVKLDTEEFPDLASALMIRGLPTLFFINDSTLKYRMEGALPAEDLEPLIEYILFDGPPPPGASPPPSSPPPQN